MEKRYSFQTLKIVFAHQKGKLTRITKRSLTFLSTLGQFCSKTSLLQSAFFGLVSMRFGMDRNFDQHSDANSGAIGESIMNRLANARSYCELYLIMCFGNF